MYATGNRHTCPPIDMFGDASQVLGGVAAGSGLAAGEPVVSVGAFAVPAKARRWELWALRRKAQVQVLRSVVEVAPAAAVIALDVAQDADAPKARALGRRLAQDAPYVSKTRYGHRLPTMVVIVRGQQGREALATALLRGDFHGSETYREVVIDTDDFPHPGRRSVQQPGRPNGTGSQEHAAHRAA